MMPAKTITPAESIDFRLADIIARDKLRIGDGLAAEAAAEQYAVAISSRVAGFLAGGGERQPTSYQLDAPDRTVHTLVMDTMRIALSLRNPLPETDGSFTLTGVIRGPEAGRVALGKSIMALIADLTG